MFLWSETIVRSRAMSKSAKGAMYKTIVELVVMFGSEVWAVTEMDMNRLGT